MEQNLSLYLHIPFCVRKCLYCDFLSGPQSADVQEQYVEALCREIQETSPEYREYQVVSVFIGGGTPSVLLPEQTIRIMETLKSCFTLTDICEISMEMNPGTVIPEKMNAYRACGINRISIGLQSANDEELKALGRIHTCADFQKAYEMAVEAGFTNINVDLMSAIPEQTLKSYQETLQTVLALQPQPVHISAYSLIVEEGTPFYEQELNLPDEDTERRMYEITDDILRKAGYHRYEISNYAKAGKECVHNKVYWQRGNYLGLGIGSASLIQNVRFHNVTDISSYVNLMLGENSIGNEIENAGKEHGEKFQAEKDCLKKGNVEKDCLKKGNAEKNDLKKENAQKDYLKKGDAEKNGLKKENAEKEQVEKLTAEKGQVEKVNAEIENVKKDNIEKNSEEEGNTEKNNMESGNAACPDKNMIGRVKKLREDVQELPVEEQMEEFMFLGLRMMEGVSERKFYENFGRRFEEVFPGVIEKHEKLGLLEVTGEDAGKIEIKEEPDLNEKCQEEQQEEQRKEKQEGKLQQGEQRKEKREGKLQQEEQRKEKQEGKLQQEEQRKEKQEGKPQQEEQRKEKQEGKLQQEERGGEFVRLRLTPHGIDVSNQVFVDFML